MGAFLSGLFSEIGPRLEERHKRDVAAQEEERSILRQTHRSAMQNAAVRLGQLRDKEASGSPLSADELQEQDALNKQFEISHQELSKLSKGSKPVADALGKVGDLVRGIVAPRKQQQANGIVLAAPAAAQSPQPGSAAVTPPFLPAGTAQADQPASPSPANKLSPPSPVQLSPLQSAMALADPEAVKQRQLTADRKRRQAMVKELDLSPRESVEFVETGRMPTAPKAATPATRKPVRLELPDKSTVDVQWDPRSGDYFTNAGEKYSVPDGAKFVPIGSSARPTIIASNYVTLDNAKQLAQSGMKFTNYAGDDIDLATIPKNMVLQAVAIPNRGTVYEPRNINDKVVKVGNVVYAVNPSEVQGIVDPNNPTGTALGVANTSSSSTHEVLGENAAGETVVAPLQSTRTPAVQLPPGRSLPGGSGRPAATPSAAPSRPASGVAPVGPGGAASTTPPGMRTMSGFMNPAQGERARSRVIPVREAATQIFGDPTNPDMKGLKDYARLADDPKSRERLGRAFKLTLDWMERNTGSGHVRADAGPISVALGQPIEWLENYFSLPAGIASQRADIMNKAMQNLTPEEREAYNATMSAFGTIVGLRSLTKASAAQASVQTIEREMPIIGVNTANSEQFMDQMGRLAEIVLNGARDANVKAVMDAQTPGLVDRIKGLPEEAKRLKESMRQPSPANRQSAPSSGKKVKVWNQATGKFEEK